MYPYQEIMHVDIEPILFRFCCSAIYDTALIDQIDCPFFFLTCSAHFFATICLNCISSHCSIPTRQIWNKGKINMYRITNWNTLMLISLRLSCVRTKWIIFSGLNQLQSFGVNCSIFGFSDSTLFGVDFDVNRKHDRDLTDNIY